MCVAVDPERIFENSIFAVSVCGNSRIAGRFLELKKQVGNIIIMTDPIADMLTRIRNAQATRKPSVWIPHSSVKLKLAELLKREGYIEHVEREDQTFPMLRVDLKYVNGREPMIRKIQRVSRPGRRVYTPYEDIPVVLNHLGTSILSTSHGLKTSREARREKLGGEILCEIY